MIPISPLSLDQLTRDTWGSYDAAAIQQLARPANDPCYRPKFYKSPDSADELMAGNGYASHGLKITPGSLIYGFYLPMPLSYNLAGGLTQLNAIVAMQFSVQITDVSMDHKFFDEPIPAWFLSNYKPTFLGSSLLQVGAFPNLLCAPYPVVGSGLFSVEIWNASASQQRIELVIGTFEPMTEEEMGAAA